MKFNLKIVAATAAVAMMSSGAAHAVATITAAGGTYSKEGLTLSGTNSVTLPNIVVTFGNNLTYQDDIFITLPGTVSVAPVPTPGLVTCAIAGSAVGYVTTVAGGWNFRVTSVTGVTIGDICTFSGLKVQGASLASSNGTLNYVANRFAVTPIQIVDQATNTTGITIKSQFGITAVTKLNGEIDVYQPSSRKAFFDPEIVPAGAVPIPAPANQADTLQLTTTVDGNGAVWFPGSPVVTVTGQSITINGPFNWTDTAPAAGDGACFDSGLIGFATWSPATSSTCSSLTLNGPLTNAVGDGYFFVPGTKVLGRTDWTGTADWTYSLVVGTGTVTGRTTADWDPGIWTINGAQVYIQYMPYGEGIGRIIYASNTNALASEVEIDTYANGQVVACPLQALTGSPFVSSPANSVTQLSAVVDQCVANRGIVNGKVAILLTFTSPNENIEVYSAYNVNGSDRGTVVNTSNGRGLFYESLVD